MRDRPSGSATRRVKQWVGLQTVRLAPGESGDLLDSPRRIGYTRETVWHPPTQQGGCRDLTPYRWYRHPLFESLRIASYRWCWIGRLSRSASMQIETVAQGWLVYQLTGSALALGWVASARSLAQTTLSLFGGAVSDRIEKRILLIGVQTILCLNYVALGLLVATGAIQVWHIVISSILTGLVRAFSMPAEKAYMVELVGRESFLNAMSLMTVGMGITGIVMGPVAGLAVREFGVAAAFGVMVALYLFAVYAQMRLPATGRHDGGQSSVAEDLVKGVRYTAARPFLMTVIALAFVRMGFGMTYGTMLPKFADDELGLDAAGLGLLTAAPSVGRLVGGMWVGSLGDYRHKGKLLLAAGFGMAVALIGAMNSPTQGLAFLFLALVGACHTATMANNNALLQGHCDPAFRGRMASMRQTGMAIGRLTSLPVGALADVHGVPIVLSVQALIFAAVFGLTWVLNPKLRNSQ